MGQISSQVNQVSQTKKTKNREETRNINEYEEPGNIKNFFFKNLPLIETRKETNQKKI